MSIKNWLGIGALLALMAGGVWVNHLRVQAGKYEQAKEQIADLHESHAEYIALRDKHDAEKAAASKGYQSELTKIGAAIASQPVPVVRLCAQPAVAVPSAEDTARGSGPGTAAAGMVQPGTAADLEAGPDIGPQLARLAERADELAAQCRAVIHYIGE